MMRIEGDVLPENEESGITRSAGLPSLDRYDVAILEALQRDARQSNAELAAHIGLSPAPTWRRVRRLEELGVITGYRAEIDRRKILPDDGLTKGMQRRYGCIGKQYQLALQAFIARVRRNRLLQFTLDTGPHFRSGGPGKGDDQQTVDIPGLHPLLPGQQMTQDTVDQHRCLTGSGSRRNQQILMTQRNGLPLLR